MLFLDKSLAVLKSYSDVLWPGALVQGRTIDNNEFAPIALPRAPGRVRLATNFVSHSPTKQKFTDLSKIAAGEVEQARDSMLQAIDPSNSVGDLSLIMESAATTREATVKLGISYKGVSFSGSADA